MTRRYYVVRSNDRYAVTDSLTGEAVLYRPFTPVGLATAQRAAERLSA